MKLQNDVQISHRAPKNDQSFTVLWTVIGYDQFVHFAEIAGTFDAIRLPACGSGTEKP
jgi:hypothetical protein